MTPPHFVYLNNPNFPRSYMKGFVGSGGFTNFVLTGNVLSFDYLFPLVQCNFVVSSVFLPPTSNVYSLDHVFDEPASTVFVGGSPYTGDVGIKWVAMQTEPVWRIQLLATLSIDETIRADLQPISGYWRLPV